MSSSFYHSFLVFLNTEYLCLSLFLTYLHLILYKNNSSVSRDFLPRHVNRHSKQSIYETNIFNNFINFKKFLTIFNSSVDYNFVFSHNFKFSANSDDNLELITVLFKLRNVFFDNFDYQKIWKTIALMVCFNSFVFRRQIYRIFIVSISSLIWLKKIPVLLFISSLLDLIDPFKKFWRFIKRNLLKIVIAQSPGYFIVLMLISYNHYYVNNCTDTLCSVDVSVSFNSNINVPSINIFDKTSILVFTIAVDCVMMSGNIKKLTCWHPKVVEILTI